MHNTPDQSFVSIQVAVMIRHLTDRYSTGSISRYLYPEKKHARLTAHQPLGGGGIHTLIVRDAP
jgi:hypothetical protein